ncbi:RPII140-upstream gene protein [Vanessa tameamea]|uniref:Complex I assembly factor TIMMDC1, mitochondrial n=1 Tax=Vanessa tameamea TaxID=334116 RepID=A0A8B8HN60_VANTA
MIWSLNRKLIFGTAVRLSPSFLIPIFSTRNENDSVSSQTDFIHKTGWDRVRDMYSKDEFGEVSVELHNVAQATMCGFFVGACLGGFAKSRDAYLHFIENNQATIFNSTIQAKKKLQDYVTVAFARGAYHWGWRLGIFTGMFSIISTTVSVYRDQSSLGDYVAAGTITGAIYKANLGPAAMVVGAFLGGVLSIIGGILILSILKLTGVSMEDIRKSFYKIKEARYDQYKQSVEKAATEKHDSLTLHHDVIVEEKGVKKIEELP